VPNLKSIWQLVISRFSDSPIPDAVGATTDAIQATADLAKAFKEQSGNLPDLKPLIASLPMLFDVLNLPAVQIATSAVPFLSVGTTLFKLYCQGSQEDLNWEECALLIVSAAYLQSLPKYLKDPFVLRKLNDRPIFESVKKELEQLNSFEFDKEKAIDAIVRFPCSELAQACNAVLVANLKASGLDEKEARRVAERTAHDAQSQIRRVIAELGERIKLAFNFFRTGGAEQREQERILEDYLAQLSKKPEEKVFGDESVRLRDIYVPVEVKLLPDYGFQKADPATTILLEDWVREIVIENRDSDKIIFIQGGPGRGKSVFCQMFSEWVHQNQHPLWTPVLIRLKDVRSFGGSFEAILGSVINRKFAERNGWLSDHRRYLFFLDGFDELVLEGRPAPELKEFLKDVGEFQKQCHDNPEKGHRVVLTGRPLALYGRPNQF
jgi:predicted NACHT family NTPase